MFTKVKNGTVQLDGDTMYYIRFGSGKKNLVMLPGLGDGLTTVKGKALPMALMYRAFAREYTVYIFSRRNHLPEGVSTRDMARDLREAMDKLGIGRTDLIGVSMGGMIAQHFAADYSDRVGRLVLVVTSPAPNPIIEESVQEWVACARRSDHTALMDSTVRRMYSAAYYRRNRWLVPVMGKLTRPASYERFLIQADAVLKHHALDRLPAITASTLVIGGERDQSLGGDASREIAAAIPGAILKMYPEGCHALYEEEKDFVRVVLEFLCKT